MISFDREVQRQRESIVNAAYVFNKLHKVLEEYDKNVFMMGDCSKCLDQVLSKPKAKSLLEKLKSGNIAEQIEVFTEKNINEFFDLCDKYCSPEIIYPVRFILLELASFFQDLVKESGIEVEEEAMQALQGGTFRGKTVLQLGSLLLFQFTNVSFITMNHLADRKPALNAVQIGLQKSNGEYSYQSMPGIGIQHHDSSISEDDGGFKNRVYSSEVSFPTSGEFEFYFKNIPEPTLGGILKDAVQQKLAQGFEYYEKIMGDSELRNNLLSTAQMYVHDSISFYMEGQAINQFVEVMQTVNVPTLEEAKSFSLNTLDTMLEKIEDLSNFAFKKMSSFGTASAETLDVSVQFVNLTINEMRSMISSGLEGIRYQYERIDDEKVKQMAGDVINQFSEHMKYKDGEAESETLSKHGFTLWVTVGFLLLMKFMSTKTIALSSALLTMYRKGLLNVVGGTTKAISAVDPLNQNVKPSIGDKSNLITMSINTDPFLSEEDKNSMLDGMKTKQITTSPPLINMQEAFIKMKKDKETYSYIDVEATYRVMRYIFGEERYNEMLKNSETIEEKDRTFLSDNLKSKYELTFERMMLELLNFLERLKAFIIDDDKDKRSDVEKKLYYFIMISISNPVVVDPFIKSSEGIFDYSTIKKLIEKHGFDQVRIDEDGEMKSSSDEDDSDSEEEIQNEKKLKL